MSRRRRRESHHWSLSPDDSNAASNAHIARALICCVRRFPGSFPNHDFDYLGAALAPAIEVHARLARRCIAAHQRKERAGEDHPFAEPAAGDDFLQDQSTLALLGQALARSAPRFRGLFDKVEETLEGYIAAHPSPADRNVEMLSRLLGLSPPEKALVGLAAAFCHGSIDRALFSFVNTPARIIQAIETLADAGAVCPKLLQPNGRLARSGLLTTFEHSRFDMEDLLRLASVGESLLGVAHADERSMAQTVLSPLAAPSAAQPLEWPHLRTEQALLKAALEAALEQSAQGVNILLHGGPGTGKTEFARQLIAQIGASGFAVADADDEGGEVSRSERLSSLLLSQTFAGHASRAVLVLDEAEDIFQSDYNHPLARIFGRSQESKSWMNALLEKNPHPVVWISNHVSHLDPAYLRRFTYCVEFPATPVAMRARIARERLTPVGCSDALIESVAAVAEVTPAHLDAAARFALLSEAAGTGPDAAVGSLIRSHLRAAGRCEPPLRPVRATRFDMRYLNIAGNATPERVLQALGDRAEAPDGEPSPAALLFSGPPGTGKTQLAAELATRLGRRLVVRTASDINSKWYGESEGNVARMFRDCDPRDELLFLDEAEVLLGSREGTGNRADRAVTAEFLRWLEVFEGIFICATNHAGSFDAALMRRFTLRMEFQPLSAQQRREMYAELALGWHPQDGGVPLLSREEEARLARLDSLTPGDFANAQQRIRALGLPTQAWLDELQANHDSKIGRKATRIGFL